MKDENNSVLITNIQRFSLHDGPGIRTVVFLKGCTIHCPWCCNPENISFEKQLYSKNNSLKTYGEYYSKEELLHEILKDLNYYDGPLRESEWRISDASQIQNLPGGVTFSGGEPLAHINKIADCLKTLKNMHIHLAVETSLFCDKSKLTTAIDYFDLFYVDLKYADSALCKKVLGADFKVYSENLSYLLSKGIPTIIRIPFIKGYTSVVENQEKIIDFLLYVSTLNANILNIELLKGHNLALEKYESLNLVNTEIKIPNYQEASIDELKSFKKAILKKGCKYEILIKAI